MEVLGLPLQVRNKYNNTPVKSTGRRYNRNYELELLGSGNCCQRGWRTVVLSDDLYIMFILYLMGFLVCNVYS